MALLKRDFWWTFPFVCFLFGYYGARRVWYIPSIQVPSLLGLSVAHGCSLLSQAHLAVRIAQEYSDNDLPHGTIISQSPAPNSTVKPGHCIVLAITKQPAITPTQDYTLLPRQSVEQMIAGSGLRYRWYPVASNYPYNTCIGQSPPAGMPRGDTPLTLYYAGNQKVPVIIPSMRGRSLQEVIDFCLQEGLPAPIIHPATSLSPQQSIVIDQRPLPGSIMPIDAIQMYLQVGERGHS